MPRPAESSRRYVAALDGLRAVAVLSVVAYHLNFSWARGGMLGVGVFFTLSGYLITDLLIAHWRSRGELGLGGFWLRRARRLLPALFLMLAAVCVLVALFDAGQLAAVRRQILAAAVYVSNWSTIAQHGSYFARFANPLPLDHLWSLAIEEQFYLVWPWLLLVGIWVVRSRLGLVLLTLAGAAGSALAMSVLYQPGYDPTRVYEGTDTRAFALLIGAALAMVWPSGRSFDRAARPAARNLLDALGAAGLAAILVLAWRTDTFSRFLYPDGFILLSLATAATVAAVVSPASRLGAALGLGPLRWVGVRSYGIYLWQWPIIVLLTPGQEAIGLLRGALAVAATLLAAALSWRYLEDPIRRDGLGRLWRALRARRADAGVRRRTVAVSGAAVGATSVVALGLVGLLPRAPAGSSGAGSAFRNLHDARARSAEGLAASARLAQRAPTRTSCRSVVYIGDSTSDGEISTEYIPDPRRRLQAQLADVGVRTAIPEISGARSIVETFEGHPNAATVAERQVSAGFRGCWILALGTNDVDNVHDGSPIGLAARIAHMMSIIGSQPTMWVNVITLLRSGPYSEQAMQPWNRDLLAACGRHPNMRVFDWASWAQPRWFITDGIHYTSPGYVARTRIIARGLARAFPAGGQTGASCLVR